MKYRRIIERILLLIIPLACILIILLNSCKEREIILPKKPACHNTTEVLNGKHPKAAKFRALLESKIKKGIPGGIMLVHDSHGIWVGAAGKADLETKHATQNCDKTMVGSITKMFTAVTILKLAEENKLSLDDKLSKWLPESLIGKLENARETSVMQLLNHTSGLYNYSSNRDYLLEIINHPDTNWRQEDIIKFAYHQPASFRPGESFAYSNTNYLLLGMIIEKATGQRLKTVFQNKIFQPLQLRNTGYNPENPVPANAMTPYVDLYDDGKLVQSNLIKADTRTADGGIYSNIYDLMVIIEAVHKSQFLNGNSLRLMKTLVQKPEADIWDKHTKYGLGTDFWETPYGKGFGHSGVLFGYLSDMYYFPDQGITYIFLINGASVYFRELMSDDDIQQTILLD